MMAPGMQHMLRRRDAPGVATSTVLHGTRPHGKGPGGVSKDGSNERVPVGTSTDPVGSALPYTATSNGSDTHRARLVVGSGTPAHVIPLR
jgi:hypothetical protein